MSKEIYISSTPHETRLAIVENDDLTEIYYERENEYTLAGSIYNGKVTRVLPGMQSSFVDVGLERDAFLYITDFMEEAGESAEFDSADAASGSRRGGRDDRGGHKEDPAPREGNVVARDEGAIDPDRPSAPPAEVRTDRTERGEREGGRRRRGSRDGRNANRDTRTNVDERGAGQRDRSLEARTPAPSPVEPTFDVPPPVHSGYLEPGTEIPSTAEVGEGAPGADGSRRWRGRRGRRRGRSSVQREESQALQQPGTSQDQGETSARAAGRGYQADSANAEEPEENFDQEYPQQEDDSFNLHASAAASAPGPAASETSDPAQAPEGHVGGSSRDRDSRDRSRRERGGRDRDQRSPRAPRGFAPSRALYGVDSTESDSHIQDGPAPEPLILPGESLSKYRKGDDGQTGASSPSSSQSVPAPRPSTEYTLQGAWDGSTVLPGETIRPRGNAGSDAGSSERPRSDRQDGRGSRDRGGRDGRGGRDDRHSRDDRPTSRRDDRGDHNRGGSQAVSSAPAVFTPAPSSDQPLEVDRTVSEAPSSSASALDGGLPYIETELPSILGVEHQASSQVAPFASAPGGHGEPTEYEPTEASASVRFDPTTRSEFRQIAPAAELSEALAHDDPEPEASPLSSIHASEHFIARVSSHLPATLEASSDPTSTAEPHGAEPAPVSGAVHSIAHTITPQPEVAMEPIHPVPLEETAPLHEFTSVQNTGDMLSEAPAPAQGEVAEPTSPLHHETAILDAVAQPQSGPENIADRSPANFEEEIFEDDEDEDFNATTLHASSIEEMDFEEELPLEGAADLGTMIREMSIDQITRPGDDPEDDEDILEEEDTVDDESGEPYGEAGEDEAEFAHSGSEDISLGDHNGLSHEPSGGRDYAEISSGEDSPGIGAEFSRDPDRRSSRRDGGRRDGRRDGRGRERGGDRARPAGGSGDRSTGRPGRRDGRHSAQTTNLPAISDLLKPGQEVLVQIAKEPIAKKGARITSHIALPGRFLVFMPTVHHTGVSRKIESDGERRRLKEILLSEKGEAAGGFIVRTAASGATEEELRSDLRFLLNLWADIKQRSESSKSPALIYHDLNLVERILRDQVTDTFSAIWVDTETEYERVLRFLQRFQPPLIRRVKLYTKETPLFEQFGITEEINKALRSKVWLKSGGSIVINQTEALVAIDINTGKYVGKTARLEDTIVKTNLDAIPEIVRQIRLRDLGGIIIIDFIDMDERKNRNKVMAALEEELKKDRAPSKVLQFNDFGLVAITRKRVKQSLERTLSATCSVCQGTGMTKSPVTVCNDIYIEMRKMQKHLDRGDVMLRVNPEVVKQLKAPGTKWLQEMEDMVGKTILVKSDPSLHPEQFDIH